MTPAPGFVTVRQGAVPLILSLPHTGTELDPAIEARLASRWLAVKDTDWWVDRLYDFAEAFDATIVRTAVSRTVIDVNRDPSGVSLYPGQATTGLVPVETFDGEALYRAGEEPAGAEIDERRTRYFEPYHEVLSAEIARLRRRHRGIVLYDCHSIRSDIPRLFEGTLPNFNIGTNGGASCDARLSDAIASVCAVSPYSVVVDGRFKGGWITRHYGRPSDGVHAVQMELACRGYMDEPGRPTPDNWPRPYDDARAAPMRAVLGDVLRTCLAFTGEAPSAVR
ncbi:MAG: N-formylglutamate deformylase [Bauldia sp.]|uniref:N-formylglutamate deformylase n=1 Tax=Bauldia sp. TaxID=2575872 RepID=UPI001DEF2FD6|nr:N-formylglutamate deformylase [Bauldia sp.]MCB1497014.1 N-formylglutamate deformylase [Bauldia sp.]